jgi:hypothetical protein
LILEIDCSAFNSASRCDKVPLAGSISMGFPPH